jgi:3-phosphoshikimate 1-carboxyvinyltransferase
MGALVEETAEGDARVGAGASLRGAGTVDLEGAPDLLPLVGILGALAPGETRVVGAGHVRFKESDRRATTVAGLRALGGDAEVRPDGIRVRGGARLSGGEVDATGDHRIVMAFGVLGLVVPGVVIRGAEAVAKSYPGFLEALGHEPGEEPARGIGPGSR